MVARVGQPVRTRTGVGQRRQGVDVGAARDDVEDLQPGYGRELRETFTNESLFLQDDRISGHEVDYEPGGIGVSDCHLPLHL